MLIVTCYTKTIPIVYAKETEKFLREKMKTYLGSFNSQFKIGSFRLHFDCKIEESSGRSHRIPRKVNVKNDIVEKIVEDSMLKIDKKLMPFFARAQKDLLVMGVKIGRIIENNTPVDNNL
jgi:hypothetical protein